jgi:GNAT superfamily N-acetyltransferase
VEVVPATAARWPHVVALLGGSGERGCWCQAWRGTRRGDGLGTDNRARLEAQVRDGAFAPGVVAYLDGEPVGWCGLGPRSAMPRLVGSRTIPAVDDVPAWSIGCFVVRPGYRRRGVARALLAGAVAYARSQGAPAVEAYPIDPAGARVSATLGFVGFVSTFEVAGFRRVLLTDAHSAGLPRWLMRLDLR